MRLALALVLLVGVTTPAAAQPCRTTFAPGLEKPSVEDIQVQLRAHGFDPGPADGRLGPRTCTAVRAYQKAQNLPVDGILDQKLQNHLRFVAPPRR